MQFLQGGTEFGIAILLLSIICFLGRILSSRTNPNSAAMISTCDFCHNTRSFGLIHCSRSFSSEKKQGNSAFLKICSQADSLEHVAGLSLFSVENGIVDFMIEGRNYTLSPGTFLMLNKGQRYRVSWKTGYQPEVLCLQFDEKQAEKALQKLNACNIDAGQDYIVPVQFVNHADKPNPAIQQLLNMLRQHISRTSTAIDPDALFSSLLNHICVMQQQAQHTIDTLGPVKKSTRVELYNRLRVARDFIDNNLHRTMSLNEVASEACLSKFHFMRLFKHAFGQTVHQYITAQRLNRARLLLELEEKSFPEICRSMGYEDVAWFAKVYKRAFGLPPSRKADVAAILLPQTMVKRAVA